MIDQQMKDGFYLFTVCDFGVGMNKEFIEKNGVEIFVESEEQRGSSFHFSLPVSDRT